MLHRLTQADETFVAKCTDPMQRDSALRRELANLRVLLFTGLVVLAIWFVGQWPYLTGTGARSGSTDLIFLCMLITGFSLTMFTHSNIRLLRGLQVLEEKLRSERAGER
jgi:hypothetical protein